MCCAAETAAAQEDWSRRREGWKSAVTFGLRGLVKRLDGKRDADARAKLAVSRADWLVMESNTKSRDWLLDV
jgi:hypothetical protein